jgi:dipeptidyl aminopeptidase/acylaminoacyl peptidase
LKFIHVLAAALAVGAASLASAQDAPAPAAPKVLDTPGAMFGVRESVESIDISPSGKRIVYVTPGKGAISSAYVADLAGGPHQLVTQSPGVPDRLRWCKFVTDTRLICQIQGVAEVDAGLLAPYSRLFAVDADGKNLKMLGQKSSEYDARLRQDDGEILDWLPAENGAVLMSREYIPETGKADSIRMVRKTDGLGVDRIDVNTMKASHVETANKLADFYITDGRGNVRMKGYRVQRGGIEQQLSTRTQFHYRLPDSKEWVHFADWEGGAGMWPQAVDADTNTAYVIKRLDGRDALYRVKLDGSMAEELVYKNDKVDVDGVVRVDNGGRVIGVSYTDDRSRIVYFDPEYDRLARALGKAIPKLPQVDFLGASTDNSMLLIRAGSDADPGRYFTFDKKTKTLNEIMLERPALENVALSPVKSMTYAAADGTQIPAYLTLPPGKADMKGLPAIVLPHGGPSSRDEWGFDWLPQYFAHQGYVVIQPNYRGSAGYGEAWMNDNGFRNWRTSIGDVTAAGKWLLAQGVDPEQLNIVGWSYGGYAALQSGVTEPSLFKHIVAIAPVTDLGMVKKEAADYTNQSNVEEFIGDGPHVVEGSPLQNVAKITAPVLMFHGTMDLNVGVNQSRKMDAALKAAGKQSELVTFGGLEHSLVDSNVRAHMLDRIDAFLKGAPLK